MYFNILMLMTMSMVGLAIEPDPASDASVPSNHAKSQAGRLVSAGVKQGQFW